MATVNYSVPDDVKAAFDKAFKGKNKSAVIAKCMQRAVDESKQSKRRENIFRLLTQRRAHRPAASSRDIQAARDAGRP